MKRVLLIVALATAGCDALPPPPEAGPSPGTPLDQPMRGTTPTPTACHDISAAQAGPVAVIMQDNSYSPDCFAISSTQAIQLANDGETRHSFTIADAVDVVVEPGNRTETEPMEDLTGPGTFDFICKYHEDDGMVGVVIVR
ncbi:MAG TPA: cupredoxin domain-containing protein [Actinomycetota bacterium]|nr:cupredoxin domain-containing protein [Actinomycetota bacterium]